MSKIMGVDCDSNKIAIVCMDKSGRIKNHVLLISHEKDSKKKLVALIDMFKTQLKGISPDVVYIEDSIFIQNYKTSKVISEVIGNIKYNSAYEGIDCCAIAVTTWKKMVVGKGNAKKEDVAFFVDKKYPELKSEMQDIKDACCICLAGVEIEKEEKNTFKKGGKNV